MTISTQAKNQPTEETQRPQTRSPTKALHRLWTAFPWLMATMLGMVLASEHFSSATKVIIELSQPTPPLKSASPYMQLQFRTLLQEINQKKQLIEQSRKVIANHQTNIERLIVDLDLAGNTLAKLRAEYDPSTLDGTSSGCRQTNLQGNNCFVY